MYHVCGSDVGACEKCQIPVSVAVFNKRKNMTKAQFEKQEWKSGMKAKYHVGEFEIATVNFEENLVGLWQGEENDISWVRCENIELI